VSNGGPWDDRRLHSLLLGHGFRPQGPRRSRGEQLRLEYASERALEEQAEALRREQQARDKIIVLPEPVLGEE
jgi:hypothetical protein